MSRPSRLKRASLSSIPQEVADHIELYLDRRDIISLRRASRRVQQLFDFALYRDIRIDRSTSLSEFTTFLQKRILDPTSQEDKRSSLRSRGVTTQFHKREYIKNVTLAFGSDFIDVKPSTPHEWYSDVYSDHVRAGERVKVGLALDLFSTWIPDVDISLCFKDVATQFQSHFCSHILERASRSHVNLTRLDLQLCQYTPAQRIATQYLFATCCQDLPNLGTIIWHHTSATWKLRATEPLATAGILSRKLLHTGNTTAAMVKCVFIRAPSTNARATTVRRADLSTSCGIVKAPSGKLQWRHCPMTDPPSFTFRSCPFDLMYFQMVVCDLLGSLKRPVSVITVIDPLVYKEIDQTLESNYEKCALILTQRSADARVFNYRAASVPISMFYGLLRQRRIHAAKQTRPLVRHIVARSKFYDTQASSDTLTLHKVWEDLKLLISSLVSEGSYKRQIWYVGHETADVCYRMDWPHLSTVTLRDVIQRTENQTIAVVDA
ncbi:MAG: hypothetical protein M1828_001976 [Chrysothrix sp. TS-e1954]|nr:MAG: hypothetical protein M1828_001976 [Chrysothrix sp. TS-e1954]